MKQLKETKISQWCYKVPWFNYILYSIVKSDAELALSVEFVGLVPLLYNFEEKKKLRELHHAKSYLRRCSNG